jgi:hypothetical protein
MPVSDFLHWLGQGVRPLVDPTRTI